MKKKKMEKIDLKNTVSWNTGGILSTLPENGVFAENIFPGFDILIPSDYIKRKQEKSENESQISIVLSGQAAGQGAGIRHL